MVEIIFIILGIIFFILIMGEIFVEKIDDIKRKRRKDNIFANNILTFEDVRNAYINGNEEEQRWADGLLKNMHFDKLAIFWHVRYEKHIKKAKEVMEKIEEKREMLNSNKTIIMINKNNDAIIFDILDFIIELYR